MSEKEQGCDTSSDADPSPEIAAKPLQKHGALFLTTVMNERIAAHLERLREQTRDLLDVYAVINPLVIPRADCVLGDVDVERLMPSRWAQMLANGGVIPGHTDLLFMPLGLLAPHKHVWMIEFDVDFAGHWGDFFGRVHNNEADVLTTTLVDWPKAPEWFHRRSAGAPSTVKLAAWHRDFHPIMRLSQRFMRAYVDEVQSPDWRGHCEFTIPTVAVHLNMAIEDLGPNGRVYSNNPPHRDLCPGTFIYRPSRMAYFHERPETFEQPNQLYHPVKPG